MITLDAIVFTLRGGDEHLKYGDPYSVVCTAVKTSPTSARITGCVGKLTIAIVKDMKAKFKELGIDEITWERIK
jgi:hypothetical protein